LFDPVRPLARLAATLCLAVSLTAFHAVAQTQSPPAADPAEPPTWVAARIQVLEAALPVYEERAADAEKQAAVLADGLIRPGESHHAVPALRLRLAQAGLYEPPEHLAESRLYDATLEAALIRFQELNGLEPDGIVGPNTRAALNATPRDRVRAIRDTLRRMRAMTPPAGERYVLVNIPAFELRLIEGAGEVFRTRVIVGARRWPSPEVESAIDRVVFNPYWTVPRSIARNEILPKLRNDPSYVVERGIRVFTGWGPDAAQVDPYAVDWDAAAVAGMPYMLRQDPGPRNALGRVKFLFPNPYSVYLHDTPSRELFGRADRALSHGCIRVQNPLELAGLILSREPGWEEDAVDAAVESGANREVRLSRPVPVRIVYWTAWVDDEGQVAFSSDLYQRDCSGTMDDPAAPCECAG